MVSNSGYVWISLLLHRKYLSRIMGSLPFDCWIFLISWLGCANPFAHCGTRRLIVACIYGWISTWFVLLDWSTTLEFQHVRLIIFPRLMRIWALNARQLLRILENWLPWPSNLWWRRDMPCQGQYPLSLGMSLNINLHDIAVGLNSQ